MHHTSLLAVVLSTRDRGGRLKKEKKKKKEKKWLLVCPF